MAGNRACVLTPNVAELGRIAAALHIQLPGAMGTHWQQHVQQITDGEDVQASMQEGVVVSVLVCMHVCLRACVCMGMCACVYV